MSIKICKCGATWSRPLTLKHTLVRQVLSSPLCCLPDEAAVPGASAAWICPLGAVTISASSPSPCPLNRAQLQIRLSHLLVLSTIHSRPVCSHLLSRLPTPSQLDGRFPFQLGCSSSGHYHCVMTAHIGLPLLICPHILQ